MTTAPEAGQGGAFRASLVVPVYDERDRVEEEIIALLGLTNDHAIELIIVDDGSTDGTSEVLERMRDDVQAKGGKIIRHESNRGYGAALKSGIHAASTGTIVISDCDGSYPNHRIPELLDAYESGGLDMLVGARTGADVAVSLARRPAKYFLNKLASHLTRRRIPDLNSGLRVFRREIAEEYLTYLCDGFSFTSTITLIMICNGYNVAYTSIEYYKRGGKSKIRPIRDTINFLFLIVSTVFFFQPLRVMLPPASALLLLSFVLMIYQAFFLRNITTVVLIFLQTGLFLFFMAIMAEMMVKNLENNHLRNLKERLNRSLRQ
jgi:glycosyltransferase involved in cell wall biosynthesis